MKALFRVGGRGMLVVVSAAALLLALLPGAAADPTGGPLVVELDSGKIKGADTGQAHVFKGIRYAAPPVGPRRWKAPQPVPHRDGPHRDDIVDATEPGNLCPQLGRFADLSAEDCLFVNVTTPASTSPGDADEPLPVMVWLHGGGYTIDGGDLYDAQRMASQGNVVVVTINYRLGVLGYFGHRGLPGSGTFGLADQIAALEWTQRNAAAFGGDPGNVTLFGQSAGAMSTCALLTSPQARGLFHKAILQSGSCTLRWPDGIMYPSAPADTPYASRAEVQRSGTRLAEQVGCSGPDEVACLRRTPIDQLIQHTGDFANHLAFHTPKLPLAPSNAMRLGLFHPVPMMVGTTRDEMRPFIAGVTKMQTITEQRYHELLRNSFGNDAHQVEEHYPLADYSSPAMAWAAVTNDVSWACNTLEQDQLLARRTPVYAYEFADRTAPNVNGIEVPDMTMGAAHASDLPYLFDLGGQNILNPSQQKLAHTMIDYWTRFAHHSDPNSAQAPRWPRFSPNGAVLRLDQDSVKPAPVAADHQCRFWRELS